MRFHLRRRGPDRRKRPALDDEDGGWIGAARQPFHDYSVGALVPVVFERYARLLHPAWAAPDTPVRWDVVAAWSGRMIHALAQWEPLSRPIGEADPGCPFVQPPDTGGLPPQQLAALCGVLAAHTSTPDRCFIGEWEGYVWPEMADPSSASELRLDQRTFLVHQESIGTAGRIGWRDRGERFVQTPPTLIWPADRAWFVAGDVDLDSTYVGGSAEVVTLLIAEPDLEVWPVHATDRVTFDSDSINGM
jgi:hypothetical protein